MLMTTPSVVQIIGAPIACAQSVKDSWREVAAWAGDQLRVRYGDAVRVQYYDLFDVDAPELPPQAQLPVVIVDGEVVSSGGKISIPAIRRHLDACQVR
jgi:disulfide oxidoreductase YuzD